MDKKEIRTINFSVTGYEDGKTIVDSYAPVVAAIARKKYGEKFIACSEMSDAEIRETDLKLRKAMVGFAASKAGLATPKTKEDLYFANDNVIFKTVLNSIITQTLAALTVRYENPMITEFASMETVGVGDSKTYEIDTKALAIAQRANYTSNVTIVPTHAKGAITIKPEVYSLGASLDFIRILDDSYDWAYDVARVYAGFVYAKYKACVDLIFSETILAGTPLYNATFALSSYTQLAEDIGMLNGSGSAEVYAFGTLTAFNTIAGIATNGGFVVKDDYIKNAYVEQIAGVRSVVLGQFTDLSAPFTTENAPSLRAIPNNLIVLVARGRDKIVKLVQENYVRAIETDAHNNNLNRMEYEYFQAFGVGIATSSFFGVQNTANA